MKKSIHKILEDNLLGQRILISAGTEVGYKSESGLIKIKVLEKLEHVRILQFENPDVSDVIGVIVFEIGSTQYLLKVTTKTKLDLV